MKMSTNALAEYRHKLKLLSGWKAHDGQRKVLRSIFNDGVRRVFIQAGRKWGKTETIMYIAWRYAMLYPYAACYIIGPTRKQQSEII